MPENLPSGDLARTVTHEANDEWPTLIEIVAYFGKDASTSAQRRKGKRVSIEIDPNEFFGRKGFGAPMSGDQIIAKINRLRRGK